LSHFDFEEYSFKVITCEHNFTPMREKIFSLLTQKGYQRILPELSKFDDWYIKPTQQQYKKDKDPSLAGDYKNAYELD